MNAAEGSRVSDVRTELLELFGRWWDPVTALIQATPSEVYDRPPVLGWGGAAVTLLGDAAHAMSPGAGQGACQALEDAVVLGACIAHRPDPAVALRAYESRRIPRASRVQRTSLAALRFLQPRSRIGEVARDLILRVPPGWLSGQQSWMFDFQAPGTPGSRIRDGGPSP
jgi:2-polyprenyl-6-methoxyphenol hydroxylase-like FAD-dependent oxidoreductase